MSWSNVGSTPGPQTRSICGSGSRGIVIHWLIFSSACAMNYITSVLSIQYVLIITHSIEQNVESILSHRLDLLLIVGSGVRMMVTMLSPAFPTVHTLDSFMCKCVD